MRLQTKFKLKGPAGAFGLIAIVAVVGYTRCPRVITVDGDVRERLLTELHAEYVRHHLAALKEGRAKVDGEFGKNVDAAMNKLEIVKLTVRGTRKSAVARVEIEIDGKPPPDGEPVRYYRLERSTMTGWRVRAETTASAFHHRIW